MISKKKEIYYVVITQKDPITNTGKKKWIRSGTSKHEAEKLERKLLSEKDEGAIILTGRGFLHYLIFSPDGSTRALNRRLVRLPPILTTGLSASEL